MRRSLARCGLMTAVRQQLLSQGLLLKPTRFKADRAHSPLGVLAAIDP